MDFDALINGLLSQGASAEDVAKRFAETLNKITAANKRKEEVEKYLDNARAAVYSALQGKATFDFKVAAKAQVIAVAAYRPDYTVDQLKEMEDAFAVATKSSADLYEKIYRIAPEVEKAISTDDEKLLKFLRAAGLSER